MANTTPEEIRLWGALTQKGVKVPEAVWSFWQEKFVAVLDGIAAVAEEKSLEGLSVEEARGIVERVFALNVFVRSIVKSEERNVLEGGQLVMETTIRQLIAHYIGNDLYKIALISDVSGPDPEPVPAVNVARILRNVAAIREFLQKLKDVTR
ncbi:MAG: hypothetical protein HQL18_00445 [Candidatus Omnitrophica bacterium]|nr:hypothetical protein [Candidatus Omnitrophota bacterium]